MSSPGVFAGSKRAARRVAAEQREVARVGRELNAIYQLAQSIRDEAHLQQILSDEPDDAQRAALAAFLEPFLPFRIQRVESLPS